LPDPGHNLKEVEPAEIVEPVAFAGFCLTVTAFASVPQFLLALVLPEFDPEPGLAGAAN